VKYRNKREYSTSNRNPPQRYSGDFDLYTQRIAQSKHPPAPELQQYKFRRAKSSEWDGDILERNVKTLKTECLSDFHLGSSSAGNMQTLDKRISASSDQLDCIRPERKPLVESDSRNRIRTSGYKVQSQEYKSREERVSSDIVFKYKGEKFSKNEYFFGNSEKFLNISDSGQRERSRKTPFQMFLEDDGPYSRKLYGPVTGDEQEPKPSHKSEKRILRNILSRPLDLKVPNYSKSEHDITERLSAVKKGLLWQQRDKLFSRWKERFFILTNDYFQCFKKGSSKVTEMGEYIFKVKLASISSVSLLDKRGFLTICLSLSSVREGRIYLRRAEGLRDWFNAIKFCVDECKIRKSTLYRETFQPVTRNFNSENVCDEEPENDEKPGHASMETISPDNSITNMPKPKGINRFSLVSDLLMSEAISYYARTKEEKSEDSGVESGNSLEITGSDSQAESSSEHSSTEEKANVEVENDDKDVVKEEVLVSRL